MSKISNQFVALVPLRGGSKSIDKKNIKFIAGKYLCAWVLEAALACKQIEKVYVSTDSDEIKEIVQLIDSRIQVIKRPAECATDTASTESVMLHFASKVDFENLITIQATSPLLESIHLEQAITQFQTDLCDSLLSVVRCKRFFWNSQGQAINYNPLTRPRRQDFEGILMENGAFYITHRDLLKKTACRLGGKVGLFEMPENTAIEIDEPIDWVICEQLLINKENNISI